MATLLVADDSVTIQKVIRLALSSESYEISTVSSGKELFQALETFHPDVVLIDISLPHGDAYEIKAKINAREDLKNTKFVLMYSAFEKIDEEKVDELKFHGRLIKPFDPSNLRKLVADVVNYDAKTRAYTESTIKIDPAEESREITFDSDEITKENMISPEKIPTFAPMNPPPLVVQEILVETSDVADLILDLPPMETTKVMSVEEISKTDFVVERKTPPPLPPQKEQMPSKVMPLQIVESTGAELNGKNNPTDRDRSDSIFMPAPQPQQNLVPPPLPPQSQPETDIRKLTDSTMKMTGLDFGGWNIDEKRKLKIDPPEVDVPPSFDDGNNRFLELVEKAKREAKEIARTNSGLHERPPAPPEPPVSEKIDPMELEKMVRENLDKTLQATLEKAIKDILPSVAESIIKREIDKILSDSI